MAETSKARRSKGWRLSDVAAAKTAVKAELDAVGAAEGQERRLAHAKQLIAELADDQSSKGTLRRFIFVVSALVHHERFGGLSPSQIRQLAAIGIGILSVAGLTSGSSKLGFLQGELRTALSLIHRKSGQPWLAAWEQQLAVHISRATPIGAEGFQALAMGIRFLRLGHVPLALREFEEAESGRLTARQKMQARIGRVKALRLAGDLATAEALAKDAEHALSLTAEEKLELDWEGLCRQHQRDGNLAAMMAATRTGRSHFTGGYVLESMLWAYASKDARWMDGLLTARYLAEHPTLRARRLGFFFSCVAEFERCYDAKIPVDIRLFGLGKILARTTRLMGPDRELLVWAAAARWLARKRLGSIAALAIAEYQSWSLRLSRGHTTDTLKLTQDLES